MTTAHANHINPNTDLVVTTELESAGLISYWRCSEGMKLDTLTDHFIEEGLDVKLLPKEPEPETALRRAVMEQQDRHRLVRAVDRHAWAIVDETCRGGRGTAGAAADVHHAVHRALR